MLRFKYDRCYLLLHVGCVPWDDAILWELAILWRVLDDPGDAQKMVDNMMVHAVTSV